METKPRYSYRLLWSMSPEAARRGGNARRLYCDLQISIATVVTDLRIHVHALLSVQKTSTVIIGCRPRMHALHACMPYTRIDRSRMNTVPFEAFHPKIYQFGVFTRTPAERIARDECGFDSHYNLVWNLCIPAWADMVVHFHLIKRASTSTVCTVLAGLCTTTPKVLNAFAKKKSQQCNWRPVFVHVPTRYCTPYMGCEKVKTRLRIVKKHAASAAIPVHIGPYVWMQRPYACV